jgi:hypothetical protein
MAAHKGPASLRPGCTRSGSSVAAIPVYQSKTFTSEHYTRCMTERSAGIHHPQTRPECSAEHSPSWWAAIPPHWQKWCSPLPASLSIMAQWICRSDKMEHSAGTAACSSCTMVCSTTPEKKHLRGWVEWLRIVFYVGCADCHNDQKV